MVEINETKAYSVTGITMKGENYISLRQMYRTKKDPTWKPGKAGMSIKVEDMSKILRAITEVVSDDVYKEINL